MHIFEITLILYMLKLSAGQGLSKHVKEKLLILVCIGSKFCDIRPKAYCMTS